MAMRPGTVCTVQGIQEAYNKAKKEGNVGYSMQMVEILYRMSLIDKDVIEQVTAYANDCQKSLRCFMKYENLINQHVARLISDPVLYFLHERRSMKTSYFVLGRTLLTPHRRWQLSKTMNAHSRTFAMGLNSNHCLGVTGAKESEIIPLPTEIRVPPVYEMGTSSRHSVFWCHDGGFFGCGDPFNFMVMSPDQEYDMVDQPMEFFPPIRRGEKLTGFKCIESGTIFETENCWYFVGNLKKAEKYLKTLHDAEFTPFIDINIHSNYFMCHSRPPISCMNTLLNDARNVAPIKFLGTLLPIKIFPDYWTELTPGHTKRRPVCYLVDGIERTDIRLENVTADKIWVSHQNGLYCGDMTLILHEDHDENDWNLDNYVLMIEMQEIPTPTPWFVTACTSNMLNGVLITCGQYPHSGFDHLEIMENRYRGNVHKFMFKTLQRFMQTEYHREDDIEDWTLKVLIEESEKLMASGLLDGPLKVDEFGRFKKSYRYANYISFLYYVSLSRLMKIPPKFADTDLDHFCVSRKPIPVVRNRMKLLYEEFERLNYPGTNIWVPTEFYRDVDPMGLDTSEEEVYRSTVMKWTFEKFISQLHIIESFKYLKDEDEKTEEIVRYLTYTVWLIQKLHEMTVDEELGGEENAVSKFLKDSETLIPDNEEIYQCVNPGKILKSRITEKYLDPGFLDEKFDITMKFRMTHRDPTLQDSWFKITTCRAILGAQNPVLLDYIEDNVLDFNKIFPIDTRLDRLIVQTFFIGHGVTDVDGCEEYRYLFSKLGYQLVISDTYMHRSTRRNRGYLRQWSKRYPPIDLVGIDSVPVYSVKVPTTEGNIFFAHRLLFQLFSFPEKNKRLPNILPEYLTKIALKGLYDRRLLDDLSADLQVMVVNYYEKAYMIEARNDLMRQIVLEAGPQDYKYLRNLVELYPQQMRHLIAECRPGILLWNKSPLPEPKLEHIKVITEQWPKNDYERHGRVPKGGNFRKIGNRELRRWYSTNEERNVSRFTAYYMKDFPLNHPWRTDAHSCYTMARLNAAEKTKIKYELLNGIEFKFE